MDWFYADTQDNQVKFEEGEFSSLVASGKIQARTLVWNNTMTDWRQASLVKPELFQSSLATIDAGGNQPNTPSNYGPTAQAPYYTPPADGLSITSMILGILGLVSICAYGVGIVPAIAALICGYLSQKEMRDDSGTRKFSSMALSGIIMGYISVGLFLLAVIGVVLLFLGVGAAATMP